jgi:saccharopine dehydrogenase-like NADP-dependent oxidoreductase
MSNIKNIAIVGASGNVGQAVLPALLAKGFKITVISRLDSKATFPSSVTVTKTAYDAASLTKAFRGQDAVISAVAASALAQEEAVVEAAVAAGVKWFVPSQFGHDCADDRVVEVLPILKSKLAIVQKLKEAESKGMSWTSVITGLFLDWASLSPEFGSVW